MIRGEIWWADFGIPYGSEVGYTRPVLIVQNDVFNASSIKTIVVVPLTSNVRLADAPGNVLIKKKDTKLNTDSVIIVAQLYAIDRSRFREKIAIGSWDNMGREQITEQPPLTPKEFTTNKAVLMGFVVYAYRKREERNGENRAAPEQRRGEQGSTGQRRGEAGKRRASQGVKAGELRSISLTAA